MSVVIGCIAITMPRLSCHSQILPASLSLFAYLTGILDIRCWLTPNSLLLITSPTIILFIHILTHITTSHMCLPSQRKKMPTKRIWFCPTVFFWDGLKTETCGFHGVSGTTWFLYLVRYLATANRGSTSFSLVVRSYVPFTPWIQTCRSN